MKTAIIYHNADLDGFCSGAIARMSQEDLDRQVTMFGYNYGDPVPDVSGHDLLILVDISLPMEVMKTWNETFKHNMLIIDHHRSFIEQWMAEWKDTYATAVLEEGVSASRLAWRYFYPEESEPRIVEAVHVWDVHDMSRDWCLYDSFEDYACANLGMQLYYGNPDNSQDALAYRRWFEALKYNFSQVGLLDRGRIIQQWLEVSGRKAQKLAFKSFLSNVPFTCVNGRVNKSIIPFEGTALCFFWYDGTKWVYSLRQGDGEHPILEVAKAFGGGGHPNACGFTSTACLAIQK